MPGTVLFSPKKSRIPDRAPIHIEERRFIMLLDAVASVATDIPGWFVVVMGLGIVFFGLICIILLITIMGAVMKLIIKNQPEKAVAAPVNVPAAQPQSTEIPNRSEFVAAVAAVIAEELGTDITKIRIESIKKL